MRGRTVESKRTISQGRAMSQLGEGHPDTSGPVEQYGRPRHQRLRSARLHNDEDVLGVVGD